MWKWALHWFLISILLLWLRVCVKWAAKGEYTFDSLFFFFFFWKKAIRNRKQFTYVLFMHKRHLINLHDQLTPELIVKIVWLLPINYYTILIIWSECFGNTHAVYINCLFCQNVYYFSCLSFACQKQKPKKKLESISD